MLLGRWQVEQRVEGAQGPSNRSGKWQVGKIANNKRCSGVLSSAAIQHRSGGVNSDNGETEGLQGADQAAASDAELKHRSFGNPGGDEGGRCIGVGDTAVPLVVDVSEAVAVGCWPESLHSDMASSTAPRSHGRPDGITRRPIGGGQTGTVTNAGTGAAPAPIADRPLPLIDLIDGAFAALRQRPRTLVTTVAGLVLPASLLEGYLVRNALGGASLTEMMNDPTVAQEVSNQSAFGAEAVLAYGIDWFVIAVSGVAVSRVVAGWLAGQDVTARQALGFTLRRWWVVLAVFFLNHLLQLIGLVLLVVPGLIAMVLFALASPVVAIEDLGPIETLKRSAALVKRRRGSVVGAVAMTAAVSYGVSNAVNLLPTLASLVLGPDRTWPLISAASMLSSLILVPFTSATMCLVYFDIRFRTEGLDLELRAMAMAREAAAKNIPAGPGR